jgi:hypothetical protein
MVPGWFQITLMSSMMKCTAEYCLLCLLAMILKSISIFHFVGRKLNYQRWLSLELFYRVMIGGTLIE